MTTRKARSGKSQRHAERGSRKRGSRGGRMFTVEGLHNTFEKIDGRVRCMIERGKPDTALACCIRKAWQEYFHRDLSNPAVEGMIRHYRSVYAPKGKRATRRVTRAGHFTQQRGGMAPLDYTMGQGITGAVYGRFPVEMGATPSVVNSLDRFFESPIGRSCDSTGGYPAPPQKGGRRSTRRAQKGGGFFDTLFQPHAPASVPRNVVEMGVSAIQGATIRNPVASPVAYQPALRTVDTPPFNPVGISPMSTLAPVYKGY